MDKDHAQDPGQTPDQDSGDFLGVLVGDKEADHDHEGRPGRELQVGQQDFEDNDEGHQQ